MRAEVADLPFERALRRRCDAAGVEWQTLRYPRAVAAGDTRGHRFVPRGGALGGVLIVHGAGNDALFSLPGMIEALTAQRLEVFTFDLDGHGRGNETLLREGAGSDSIAAALEAWGARARAMPLHAVGISFGGSLLLGALPELSDTLSSATLISAPLRISVSAPVIRRELGGALVRTLWRERKRVGISGLIPSFGPFRRGTYPLRLGERAAPGAFGYSMVLNRILDSLGLEAAAERTRVPVLLVYGGRDLLVPVEQGRRLAELLPAAELRECPRHTHLTAALAPETLSGVLEWVRRHQGARAVPA